MATSAKKTTPAAATAKAKSVVKTAAAPKAAAKAKPAAAKVTKKAPAKPVAASAAASVVKPVKTTFTKASLVQHIVAESGVDAKSVKSVLAALDNTVLGSVSKKGAGEFMLSGMFKVVVQNIPAKKARKGIDPFTKEERVFAAKPATRRVKIRALKKLKDAAL